MTAILRQLKQINTSLSLIDDDKEDFDASYCAIQEGLFNYDDFKQLLHERSQTEFGQVWSAYRRSMLSLAKIYRQADETARGEIRNELKMTPFAIIYSSVLAEELTHVLGFTKDATLIPDILAIASMCDWGYGDSLAVHFALTRLYNTASGMGINPMPYFVEMAALSSDAVGNDSTTSTRKLLSVFEPVRSW